MPPAIFVGAVAGSTTGNSIRFEVPTASKAGDTLLVATTTLSANAGPNMTELDDWTLEATFVGATNKLWILRREVVAGEGAHVDIPFAALPDPALGGLAVYRNLDNGAALVGASATAIAASVNFVCPSRTLTRYSDLYVGIVLVSNDEVVMTPPAGTIERLDAQADGLSIEIFDLLPEATGATGTKTATPGLARNGIAASLALSANALVGFGKSFTVEPIGAPGLPRHGV